MCNSTTRGISFVLALVSGFAWADVRDDFEKLTESYAVDVEEETGVLSRVFVREILVLENEALAEGDFETAIKCRDRRRKLGGKTGSPQGSGSGEEGRVSGAVGVDWVFVPEDSAVSGFERKGGILSIDTSGSTARVEWNAKGIPPGGYQVEIELAGRGRGAARLEEAHFFVVKTLSEFTTVNMGNLKISSGDGPLVLVFEQLSAGNSLEVRQVKLISNAAQ